MGIIYKITSPSGRVYVGKTKRLRIRIWEYRWRSKKRKSIIHDSIKGYGWEAHKLEVIEEIADELLNEREIFWIKELNTFYKDNPDGGMNMTKGGDGNAVSWMHDIERRKKQSERFKGKNGTFYGKHHTEEAKRSIAKKTSEYNKKHNRLVPKWGAEKGRLKVIRGIVCYDKYGNFLKEYDSLAEAERILKVSHTSIFRNCNNTISGVDGKYVFRYKTPGYPLNIEVGVVKEKTTKRPVLYIDKHLRIIKEYESAYEASIDLKVPKPTINRAALREDIRPIRLGHIFLYKDLYLKIKARKTA